MPLTVPAQPAYWDPALLALVTFMPLGDAGRRGPGLDGHSESVGSGALDGAAWGSPGPVLVVDDDPTILSTVQDILEMEGYPVVAAADGAEALRRAGEVRPSLVLLDMRMPGITGWEVARELRERGIAVPILVMTAAQDARLWADQIGAAGVLAKPFDLDDLLTAVERFWPA